MARVLVPFDGSNTAANALSFACEKFGDDAITVLFVVDTAITHQPERYVGMKLSEIYDRREEEGEGHLAAATEMAADRGVSVETELAHGKPSKVILRQISDDDADHVVMGSHSRTPLERFFLGSVAERVVERSPVSVTVIRPEDED